MKFTHEKLNSLSHSNSIKGIFRKRKHVGQGEAFSAVSLQSSHIRIPDPSPHCLPPGTGASAQNCKNSQGPWLPHHLVDLTLFQIAKS